MRKIGVVTGTRADYGLLYWVLRKIEQEPTLSLKLIVTGMHLSPEFGLTIKEIEKDGFKIHEKIEMLISSDTKAGIAKSMGLGMIGFAQAFERIKPNILLVLGDRFEILSAVVTAMTMNIPIAHLHGGETTEGAIDNLIRHAITKMSHLHFVSTKFYGKCIEKMNEESWRIFVVGASGLDYIKRVDFVSKEELEQELNIKLENRPLLLVTYHPVTLEYDETEKQIDILLKALKEVNCYVIFTYPNADAGNRIIINKINEFVNEFHKAKVFINLGQRRFINLLKHVDVMAGNSSSGIIESPSFKLPTVNIGTRQKGRIRAKNVIDVNCQLNEIVKGIQQALTPEFRDNLKRLKNPFGNGNASNKIVDILKSIEINDKLLRKVS